MFFDKIFGFGVKIDWKLSLVDVFWQKIRVWGKNWLKIKFGTTWNDFFDVNCRFRWILLKMISTHPLHSQKDLQGEQHLLLQLAKPRHLMGKHFGNTLMRAAQFQTSFPPNAWSDFDEDIFLLCSFWQILGTLTWSLCLQTTTLAPFS